MTVADHRTTIGITRHFTTADVHPYDQVKWERRDARITNWKDGSVAFEQLGVEVPADWSLNATNILAQKYFRGTPGTPEREWSFKQVVDRVADTVTEWGVAGGYFENGDEAEAFRNELKYILVTQRAAFNSPVWFNIGVAGVPQQASACFILSVDDDMNSILNWYKEEGIIFKGGSGAGVNLSKIRSSAEILTGGGSASGPVSFMRGADASAGTIKSGGKTRRAAKMIILDISHPDVEEFIWCKAIEERKARALRDAGFDMDLDGKDSFSVQYQNANNSVRVTDEFMQAVIDDADWHLRAVKTGEIVKTVRARDLMRQFAEATWECADPGMQFDTTINRWHTAANTDRINGSNPCFPGSARVHTNKGLVRFDEMFKRANDGEAFKVYTHDATNPDEPNESVLLTTPEAFMITGVNDIVRLSFSNGAVLRCTPNHRVFTTNRGYVEAKDLTEEDKVKMLDLESPAVDADISLPIPSDPHLYRSKGDSTDRLNFPEDWSEDFAHYLGWLVGDGSTSGASTVTIYGSEEDRQEILTRHYTLATWMNGGREPKLSVDKNGVTQLRLSRHAIKRFMEELGVKSVTGPNKEIPWSIEQAPKFAVAAFLRGLFDADGCAVMGSNNTVQLGSASEELLRGAQRLLTTFGIGSRIYKNKEATENSGFTYTRKSGETVSYGSSASYSLRISGPNVVKFAEKIGFALPRKAAILSEMAQGEFYNTDQTTRLVKRSEDGVELTYNLKEPRNHSYVVDGVVVRNCSEYMHVDNSACNLASLNLMKFLNEDGSFDVVSFRHSVEVMFTAQEILVDNADYPTPAIGENTRKFRQLGLGYANIGATLMALGLPYDSDGGRAWAGAITALMTGHAYATSARTSARLGPFAGYAENEEHVLNVLSMHRDAVKNIDATLVPSNLLSAAQSSWDTACEIGNEYGVRNAQATVLAPTGCLVGDSLVATNKGLVRLASLGDVDGQQWQDLDVEVLTDEGKREATKFYINGLENVVNITTARGYSLKGTAQHRIKVIDSHGDWVWRRFADLRPGDTAPMARGQMIGEPQTVSLPALSETMSWAGERHVVVPERMTSELAELVGYFMGDGSLHSRGLRLCVAAEDFDVVGHLQQLSKELFNIEPRLEENQGYISVELNSVRLVKWWEAAGFAKHLPHPDHMGKGYVPHIPNSVLASNNPEVYRAFLRGLFEADGTTAGGYPSFSTSRLSFSNEVQSLLLALGFVTTRRHTTSGHGSTISVLRLLNQSTNMKWLADIGFISGRKSAALPAGGNVQSARYDHIPVTKDILDRIAPLGSAFRNAALQEFRRSGTVTRALVERMVAVTPDPEVDHLLGFFYDRVHSVELGDEELTYDISVPENVTYVANGFISHNTIGLLMDCDTTGVEPDLGLVKMKKLVGGGTMMIVNQTVGRALKSLGYDEREITDIVAYIDEHKSILGAPHLKAEHVSVFGCSMGDNVIHHSGHVRMMAAAQPFISGAISKTVNLPEEATVEEIEQLHIDAWKLGVKAIAVYRDNCKVGQPLSTAKKDGTGDDAAAEAVETVERIVEKIVNVPERARLPRARGARTFEFRVADCKGFITVGEYADGRPGEIFVRVSKQGSTLAGIVDALSVAVSHGLQYGVPMRSYVKAFTGMRFEPAGMTDDPDIRIANSLIDYLFRKLAIIYLTPEERHVLNIYTTEERTAAVAEEPTLPIDEDGDMIVAEAEVVVVDEVADDEAFDFTVLPEGVRHSDAPLCMLCGVQMVRSGSCHACPSCGSTSGCS